MLCTIEGDKIVQDDEENEAESLEILQVFLYYKFNTLRDIFMFDIIPVT